MAHSPQAELGSASVEEGNTVQQIRARPVSALAPKTASLEKSHETTAGHHAQQESCGGNGTFVVGMLVRCELCGKKFINSFYLNKHIHRRHGGETGYPDSPDADGRRQLTTAASLLREKESASPSALVPCVKADSRALASDYSGVAAQEAATEIHPARQRHIACAAGLSQFRVSQSIMEQNEVLLSKLQSTNEKVKAEVHKEVNDVLKTFQAMLKNEIRGLQTQLAGLEANEEKRPRERVTCRTPVAGESRHQVDEVTSDPEIPFCFGTPHEKPNGQKVRPGSAPESKLATVRSSSCAEGKSLRDTKETLRQAIRTLLTFSHREFFLRAQMTNVIKHNSKPLPEEIERHLGLPPLSISSQLARSFLTEGFQHCHRSGLTTGNAPQNFESVAGAPTLFGPDGNSSYHFQKNKDFSQRRFSLKFIRLRDRLRMRPPSPGKIAPSSGAAPYTGVSAITHTPLHLPFVHRQLGYRQLVQPVQTLPYPCPSPVLPPYPGVDPAAGPSTLLLEKQLSKPFKVAYRSPAQNRSEVDVKSYTQEGTPAHAGMRDASAQQRLEEGFGAQSSSQTAHVSPGPSTFSHTLTHRGVSSVYGCSRSASTRDREPLKERAKSVVEANYVRPAYPADPLLSEPSLHGRCNFDCSSSLPNCNTSAAEGAACGAWPCPSSWIPPRPHGNGNLRPQGAGSSPQVTTGPRSLSAARLSLCEEKTVSANATAARLISNDSDGNTAEPGRSTFYARLRRGSQKSFGKSGPVEVPRHFLHHQNLWQYAVQEG